MSSGNKFFDKAVTSFNQQDWPGARSFCRKTLNHQPKHGGAHHLLGLMLYNTGDYSSALTHLENAARIDTFDSDFFGQRAGYGIQTQKPVFIVGMPRSGTTLIESIIGSHSQCHGVGELSLLADIRLEFEDNSAAR